MLLKNWRLLEYAWTFPVLTHLQTREWSATTPYKPFELLLAAQMDHTAVILTSDHELPPAVKRGVLPDKKRKQEDNQTTAREASKRAKTSATITDFSLNNPAKARTRKIATMQQNRQWKNNQR